MIRTALRNPHLVVVLVLVVVLFGVTVAVRMPADILPIFKTPAVQILTLYPGMPTETMERDITNRLERWTSQANGVALQESKSLLGVSVVRDYRYRSRQRTFPGFFARQLRPLLPAAGNHSADGHALRPNSLYSIGPSDGFEQHTE